MQTRGVEADVVTCCSLISALERGGQWQLAEQVFMQLCDVTIQASGGGTGIGGFPAPPSAAGGCVGLRAVGPDSTRSPSPPSPTGPQHTTTLDCGFSQTMSRSLSWSPDVSSVHVHVSAAPGTPGYGPPIARSRSAAAAAAAGEPDAAGGWGAGGPSVPDTAESFSRLLTISEGVPAGVPSGVPAESGGGGGSCGSVIGGAAPGNKTLAPGSFNGHPLEHSSSGGSGSGSGSSAADDIQNSVRISKAASLPVHTSAHDAGWGSDVSETSVQEGFGSPKSHLSMSPYSTGGDHVPPPPPRAFPGPASAAIAIAGSAAPVSGGYAVSAAGGYPVSGAYPVSGGYAVGGPFTEIPPPLGIGAAEGEFASGRRTGLVRAWSGTSSLDQASGNGCGELSSPIQSQVTSPTRVLPPLRFVKGSKIAPNRVCCNALLAAYARAKPPQFEKVNNVF